MDNYTVESARLEAERDDTETAERQERDARFQEAAETALAGQAAAGKVSE